MADFFNSLLFSGKTAFLQLSADFVTEFEFFFLLLKVLQTKMQIDVNCFFVAQVVPEIYAKTQVSKSARFFFAQLVSPEKCCFNLQNASTSSLTPRFQGCRKIKYYFIIRNIYIPYSLFVLYSWIPMLKVSIFSYLTVYK